MCGICGIAAAAGAPDRELLERMCEVMVHRGPDDRGFVVRDRMGLGMCRLSIIDLAGGRQPFSNEDETVWVVFNGEIYNHPDLRDRLAGLGHRFRTRSDTEVLLRSYEQWGDACVEQLNGMFAFAVWDERDPCLLLARDRIGIKPLYYSERGDRLLFASELKALLEDRTRSRRVDLRALDDYLALEYVPSPRSILEGVRKLEPGHVLRWSPPGPSVTSQYWDVDLTVSERPRARRPVGADADALRAVIREGVRKELISDVPLGVFLSGGLDSSAVAAMMTELTPGNVKSFSIGFTDRSFDESNHARTVARHLGTDHHELILEPRMLLDLVPSVTASLDEPLGDASIIPTYLLSKFTREHVKVALSGDGGDELFAGYPTVQAHRLAGYYEHLPATVRKRLVPALVDRLPVSLDNISLDFKARRFVSGSGYPVAERHVRWSGSFTSEERTALLAPDVTAQLTAGDEPDLVAEHARRWPLGDPLNTVLYLDMKLYLENDILVKTDRASMMASLEARVPLLNSDVVAHVASLPVSLKLRGLRSKYLLRRALRGVLPDSILRRGKKGFGMPVAKWFRGPLREHLLDALAPEKLAAEGFFNPAYVSALVDDHLAGRRDNRKQLWTLFVFERWYERYVAGDLGTGTLTPGAVG